MSHHNDGHLRTAADLDKDLEAGAAVEYKVDEHHRRASRAPLTKCFSDRVGALCAEPQPQAMRNGYSRFEIAREDKHHWWLGRRTGAKLCPPAIVVDRGQTVINCAAHRTPAKICATTS